MPTRRPGTTPPRKSPPIETLPVAPYTTAMMLGGMRLAIVEAAAMSAAVKARSYPSRCISGPTVRVSTATSAADDPEMPAKNMVNSCYDLGQPAPQMSDHALRKADHANGNVRGRHQVAD